MNKIPRDFNKTLLSNIKWRHEIIGLSYDKDAREDKKWQSTRQSWPYPPTMESITLGTHWSWLLNAIHESARLLFHHIYRNINAYSERRCAKIIWLIVDQSSMVRFHRWIYLPPESAVSFFLDASAYQCQ